MKPSFALDFRDGVISLLHRTARGWQQVGASPLDAADLGDALTYLRSTALGLSPRGLSTKLVIPNEMILYTQVHAPGPEVAKRRKQIRLALEGLTPYKVEDLIFDWWGTGPEVQVAVVARETLAEAEAFAIEHRFNPVSFVGAPETGDYMGEPFFGPSALSSTLLADGEKVERDQDPVSVMVREFGKAPPPEGAARPLVPEAVTQVATLKPEAPPAPPPVGQQPVGQQPVAPPSVAPPSVAPPSVGQQPVAKAVVQPVVANAEVPERVVAAAPEPVKVAPAGMTYDPLPDFTAAKAPAKGVASFDPAAMAVELVDEAPMAVDVADDIPPPAAMPPAARFPAGSFSAGALPLMAARAEPIAKPAEVKPDTSVQPSATSAVIAAFASRRAAAEPGEDKAHKAQGLGPAPQLRPSVPRPALAKPAAALPGSNRGAVQFPAKTAAVASKFPLSKGIKPLNSGQPVPQIKRDRNVVQLPKQAVAGDDVTTATTAKPAVKTNTGLDGRPVAPRGKPRYLGVILTGLLLLALALVAAWSSYFLTANEPDPSADPATTAVASAPEAVVPVMTAPDTTLTDATLSNTTWPASVVPDTVSPDAVDDATVASDTLIPDAVASYTAPPDANAIDALPTAQDEALADGQDPAAVDAALTDAALPAAALSDAALPMATAAALPPSDSAFNQVPPDTVTSDTVTGDTVTGDTVTSDTVAAATPEPAAPVVPEPVAAIPEPAPGTLVTTEAAQVSAVGNDPQDEIFLADADTPPQTWDPLALPQVAATLDPVPDAYTPAPPFGTLYTFDAEGRIQPTPEGIMTPEGVFLIAGAPKIVPPNRPAALTNPAPITAAAPIIAAAPVPTADTAATNATTDSLPTAIVAIGSTTTLAPNASLASTAMPAAAALETFPSDPALADKRPKARPTGLVDPGAATAKQGEVLAPAANSRFASLRPQSRPAAMAIPATRAAAAATDAELTNGAAGASLALNGVKSSALALAVSKKPAARPSGMDQAVNAAVAAAVRAPEPQPQVEVAAPEAQAEPEVATAAPILPTNASVAKQATTKDAINLSRVALLGIFGTASGRYAMIRQPTGGVKKVKVGDTIDGGRIAAITETTVQYQKGGRMLTLSLPTG